MAIPGMILEQLSRETMGAWCSGVSGERTCPHDEQNTAGRRDRRAAHSSSALESVCSLRCF